MPVAVSAPDPGPPAEAREPRTPAASRAQKLTVTSPEQVFGSEALQT